MTDKWESGKTYVPGSLVTPGTNNAPTVTAPANPSFEDGDTGWSNPTGWSIGEHPSYSGSWCAQFTGPTAVAVNENDTEVPVNVGQRIQASCFVLQGEAAAGQSGAAVMLIWYDATHAQIGYVQGNAISDSHNGWKQSAVSASAPAGAAYARIGISGTNNTDKPVSVDAVSWTYAYVGPPAGLIFKATQAAPGKSGSTEPVWPTTTGVSVIDNEVTWEGVIATRIVWKATPILKSGDTEPDWPTEIGSFVRDGTINWETIDRRVSDPKCPQSKVVAIMSSKVFAADKDIVRFSATVDPLDWSTAQDAGYLPTGLQQANANDMAVLAPYRSNLTAFNASSFQNWQVDPDPSAMAILDQMDGIGSTYQQAAQPVGTELYYLSQLGVRSVSVAAGSDNLAAGDVGMPIDPLVQAAMAGATSTPRAAYYPSAGQYWLAFADDTSEIFVFTLNGGKGKWSRYAVPFSVDAYAQLGNDLYIRNGDVVSVVDESLATDDVAGVATNFPGVVQWPWLDFGHPGMTKMMEGFDYVGTGQPPSVSVGFDQRDTSMFTEPYLLDGDTLPGGIIPLPVAAPTLGVRLDFAGGEAWAVQAVELYLDDTTGQP